MLSYNRCETESKTILDLYDRRIVAYKIGTSNNNQLLSETFDEAVALNPGAHPLLQRAALPTEAEVHDVGGIYQNYFSFFRLST